MTIEQLRYFCIVARFKNISRAAEHLYISNSALSRHIASLEADLGVQLLVRDGRSIDLTAAGRYVFEKAPGLIEAFDKFQDSVGQIHKECVSTIIVACLPMYHCNLFDVFRHFNREYPEYKLMINPMHSWHITDSVANRESDIGITYDFELFPHQLRMRPILQEHFAVLVSQNHPFSKLESVSVEDLATETLLVARRPTDPDMDFLTRIGQLCPNIRRNYALSELSQVVFQVKAGSGIAIFPQSICEEYGSGCVMVPINDQQAVTNIVAVWRDEKLNPQLVKFIELLSGITE